MARSLTWVLSMMEIREAVSAKGSIKPGRESVEGFMLLLDIGLAPEKGILHTCMRVHHMFLCMFSPERRERNVSHGACKVTEGFHIK
eukprot:scaffold180170_cov19-Tisochrysis_lutea.AAC.1